MGLQPLVSVIIATLNEEENIVRCLKSVKKQKSSIPTEIIVVDNHSKDKTIEKAKTLADKILLFGPERSPQRNKGVSIARGKWLLILDADMEISANVLEECLNLTKKFKKKIIIAVNEEAVGYTFWGKALALEKKCYKLETGWIHAARFFSRTEYLKLGGYDNNLVAGEDWDITQRFIKAGYNLLLTKKSIVIHHEPKEPLSNLLKKEIYYLKNIKKYAQKNPEAFSYQQNPFYRIRIWIRAWKILLPHPILTMGFLTYKCIVWIIWMLK